MIDKISKLPDSPSAQLQAYRDYRGIQLSLNNQMLDQVMQQGIFLKAAKLLGVLRKKQLMLESENEINLIVDFAIHDYYVEEKNAVQLFLEEHQSEFSPEETQVVQALLNSYTSLFAVEAVDPSNFTVELQDCLNPDLEPVILTDIGMSQSFDPEKLLFTRVLTFEKFNISSGAAFAFDFEIAEVLLKMYTKKLQKFPKLPEDTKRFLCFFKLYRQYGYEVGEKSIEDGW